MYIIAEWDEHAMDGDSRYNVWRDLQLVSEKTAKKQYQKWLKRHDIIDTPLTSEEGVDPHWVIKEDLWEYHGHCDTSFFFMKKLN